MKHIVGFAPYSKVHLGTHGRAQSLAGISPVAGCIEQERPEVTVETVTAQFGKAPMTASVAGKVKFSRALKATVDPEKRRYDQILSLTEKQAVILFDCGAAKAAWLVSQLSVILDLVCHRIRINGWRDLPMHATPQADGGAAAAAVLKDPSVYKLEFAQIFEDNTKLGVLQVVKEIYCAMSQRQILQELRASVHRSRSRRDYHYRPPCAPPKCSKYGEILDGKCLRNATVVEKKTWMHPLPL